MTNNEEITNQYVSVEDLIGSSNQLHDTHAHMDYLKKRDPSLDPAKLLANHEFWIQPGVNLERDDFCLANYMQYNNMYFMIGAHPGEVNEDFNLNLYLREQVMLIEEYRNKIGTRIIGIGEIGLDYREGTSVEIKEKQKLLFVSQIKLANELGLPFVIHCRNAFEDLFEILQDNQGLIKRSFLIHCFTGSRQDLLTIKMLGGYVGLGGVITYPSSKLLVEAIKDSEICDNYVLETDLPWLAPQDKRGQINMPDYIQFVAIKLANLQGVTSENVWNRSRINTSKIFGI